MARQGTRRTVVKGPSEAEMLTVAVACFLTALVALICFFVYGCCPKPVPVEGPVRTVIEGRDCELPALPSLQVVKTAECPANTKLVCFTPLDGAKLALNHAAMKQWIREVQIRCSRKPDAGVDAKVPRG